MSRKKSGLTHEALCENIVSGMQQGADPRMPELVFEPDFRKYLRTRLPHDFPTSRFARIFCDLGDFPSLVECINDYVRSKASPQEGSDLGGGRSSSKRPRTDV
eukprot:scaffold574_cov246-Pinguiococcus_pyrenoidosus.AAC.24